MQTAPPSPTFNFMDLLREPDNLDPSIAALFAAMDSQHPLPPPPPPHPARTPHTLNPVSEIELDLSIPLPHVRQLSLCAARESLQMLEFDVATQNAWPPRGQREANLNTAHPWHSLPIVIPSSSHGATPSQSAPTSSIAAFSSPHQLHHQHLQQYQQLYSSSLTQESVEHPPSNPATSPSRDSSAEIFDSPPASPYVDASLKLTGAMSQRKLKKPRFKATHQDLQILTASFNRSPFPSKAERRQLAHVLSIDDKQVKIWFQNARARIRAEGTVLTRPPPKSASNYQIL
ncbi:hypothetical protein BC830DRAFT_1172333 [Chytriomyces sp. MP71]|nr:hypothetical protein BC830DRAFT_1172333 [Chytriomyces sp. MP71]